MTIYEMNYKKSDIKAFFDENIKKKLLRTLAVTYSVIGAVVFFVFLVASLVMGNNISFAKPLPYIFAAVLVVIIFLALLRTLKKTPEKMYRDFMSMYDRDVISCSFSEDRLYISNTDVTSPANGYIMYSDLEKVVESDNYFYVFINRENAQIVRKSAITHGSVEETRNFLKKAVGNNYNDITKYRRS